MKSTIAKLINIAYRFLYWPICRAYAKLFVKDKPADAVLSELCKLQFWTSYRYWPNFRKPRRFSEKLWSRMLYDRDPRLTLISDKIKVRDYVAERVGREYLIPLLWQGDSAEDIPYDRLPDRFVIKTNHGCGYVILMKDKARINKKQVREQLERWLKENFGRDTYLGIAWGYNNIKPAIMIEAFIGEAQRAPVDYKFYCYGGRVEFATLHFDRFGEHRTRSYDRDFEPHEFKYDFNQWTGEFVRPSNYGDMVRLAELLARDFDFMRVDLYSAGDAVFFGELTPYPGGVNTKFLPARQEWILGKAWPSR
jgi:hypothetical protein